MVFVWPTEGTSTEGLLHCYNLESGCYEDLSCFWGSPCIAWISFGNLNCIVLQLRPTGQYYLHLRKYRQFTSLESLNLGRSANFRLLEATVWHEIFEILGSAKDLQSSWMPFCPSTCLSLRFCWRKKIRVLWVEVPEIRDRTGITALIQVCANQKTCIYNDCILVAPCQTKVFLSDPVSVLIWSGFY